MATRAQVYIVDTGVYLYKHWDGDELPRIVAKALHRKQRWDDEEYLTRIIFSEMISWSSAWDDETGFGIGTEKHGDIDYLVTININEQRTVQVNEELPLSFEAFIEKYLE